jgi:hypothetical protein
MVGLRMGGVGVLPMHANLRWRFAAMVQHAGMHAKGAGRPAFPGQNSRKVKA